MQIKASDLWARARMEDRCRAIVQMERNGFKLDTNYCAQQAANAEAEEARLLAHLSEWLIGMGQRELVNNFNWASPKQLVNLFHDRLKLPPSPVWKKGRVHVDRGDRKLDEAALQWLRNKTETSVREGIDLLIALRRTRGSIKYLTKLPTYVAPDGFVHAVSGPASDGDDRVGTITWRLASKNPEILQIPTDPKKDPYAVRRAFVAPDGWGLICADETALEAVIFAHVLIKLFGDYTLSDLLKPGVDLHAVNAKRVFGEYLHWECYGRRVDEFPDEAFKSDDYPELKALRQDIKAIWYGLMYGKSPYGFATSLRDAHDNPIGIKAAEQIVAALYAILPSIPRYQSFVLDYIQEHHGVPGLSGAWCDLSLLTKTGQEWDLKRAHRIAQNYPMQEGGALIIGLAMVAILEDRQLIEMGLTLERQVHDELDFRYPLSSDVAVLEDGIRRHMTSFSLESHLQVTVGKGATWYDC